MGTTKIAKQGTATNAGDDGEAMAQSPSNRPTPPSAERTELTDQQLVIPDDVGWYVAVVRCNCEVRIAEAIKADMNYFHHWFDYWVPMQKIVYLDKRTNKRRTKQKTFLSTFIFCHVSKSRLDDIRFRSDVYKMLTMPGQREIYRISDEELYAYRQIVENPDIPANPHTGPLKKGQRVRIIAGNMKDIEAYVQRISGKKAIIGNEIKYISGATITIDRSLLKVIEPHE